MNGKTGDTRSNFAKRRAVETVIDGPGGEKLSNRRAAALAGVSHHLVHLVRRERAMEGLARGTGPGYIAAIGGR
ncbi:hypothetical protein [Methylorubrum thiocyanatum]|uniref:hypothetical protein n=1 Tax=Methylorubrum thiocyanatum TaxID=47958 RepID=UPI003F81414C